MKKLLASDIRAAVAKMCIEANSKLPNDIESTLRAAENKETWDVAKTTLGTLVKNIDVAKSTGLPICQDTGMACIFAYVGQDVHIVGDFEKAINDGVRDGYESGYLRKSVVADPLLRTNTGDNTPAVISVQLVPGDKLKLEFVPKGFGSENMSRLAMLKPSDSIQGVKDFVIQTVKLAGSNACPPMVVGVGIGGTFDKVAHLAKKALFRPISTRNGNEFYAEMERELLSEINAIGSGPQGFGGECTALCVNIETFATHIAGLPVAVNISCHVTRHAQVIL